MVTFLITLVLSAVAAASARTISSRADADGKKMPVVHLDKFDCREYNQGNPKYSLCATDKDRVMPKQSECKQLASDYQALPKNINYTIFGESGFANDSSCWIEAFNDNDANSARGLVNVTFDSDDLGAFVKAQSEACFFEGSPFNYAHCSISDPIMYFMLWSRDAPGATTSG